MSRGVFLSWAPFSRRTETLARLFELEPFFAVTPWPKRPFTVPLKYPWQAGVTAAKLRDGPGGEVWVMDPPLPAVWLAARAARRRGAPLVVDMHTVAFYAPEWRLLRPLERPLLRTADAVVVTNASLAARVRSWGARPFVLPDPLPQPPAMDDGVTPEPHLVTVVATFSKDEPLELLPPVARALPDVRLEVTGTPRGDLSAWPTNLVSTGFLDDEAYWRQLRRSTAVMVLTTRPDTLLSGGYEAMVTGRPLVTSDQEVLRDYYGDAAAYAAASVEGVVAATRAVLDDADAWARRLHDLAVRRAADWQRAAARLAAALGRVS